MGNHVRPSTYATDNSLSVVKAAVSYMGEVPCTGGGKRRSRVSRGGLTFWVPPSDLVIAHRMTSASAG
jgi:hypothetical protein